MRIHEWVFPILSWHRLRRQPDWRYVIWAPILMGFATGVSMFVWGAAGSLEFGSVGSFFRSVADAWDTADEAAGLHELGRICLQNWVCFLVPTYILSSLECGRLIRKLRGPSESGQPSTAIAVKYGALSAHTFALAWVGSTILGVALWERPFGMVMCPMILAPVCAILSMLMTSRIPGHHTMALS